MNYKHAIIVAIIKRTLGWLIFIPAFISTCVSLLELMHKQSEGGHQGVNAVIFDFIKLLVEMIQYSTHFLNWFWQHAPVIDFKQSNNAIFWLIYIIMFVALALISSGAKMWRQISRVKEGIDDQLILQQLNDEQKLNRQQLMSKIKMPHHSLFLQFFPLYILPIVLLLIGYFVFKIIGII